jgi:hypothetical protein
MEGEIPVYVVYLWTLDVTAKYLTLVLDVTNTPGHQDS